MSQFVRTHPGGRGQGGDGDFEADGHPGGHGQRGGGHGVPVFPTRNPGQHHRPKVEGAHVLFIAPGLRFRCRLGNGPAQITDGYGGWVTVDRPMTVPITAWQGTQPWRMSIPILFDGFDENRSIQKRLNHLLSLGRRDRGHTRPPVFRAFGPIPFSGDKMVMESTPDFGTEPAEAIRNRRGRLVRQVVTVHLMQYVAGDEIKFSKRRGRGPEDVPSTYKTKKGDTLNKISVRFYGDTSRAHEIGQINGRHDVRRKLPANITLRLPAV